MNTPSSLQQLSKYTTIVADTGNIEEIKRLKPVDATTNPSLLLSVALEPEYRSLLQIAAQSAKKRGGEQSKQLAYWVDAIAVEFGKEILNAIPGRVSTEVDARLSFDLQTTVEKARQLIQLYEQGGIERDRVLIKIASTWEGIQAASILEQEGINCNLTLLFSIEQAVAAAEAGAFLISPFVGRILDWHKANDPEKAAEGGFDGINDPGVQSVQHIYHYFKAFQYSTIVMGASFRNIEEIKCLAGCDRLTISPALLDQLEQSQESLPRLLSPESTPKELAKITINEPYFRWKLNDNPMASDKLADGIRRFAKDQTTLESKLLQLNML